jgi:hypothetical protein
VGALILHVRSLGNVSHRAVRLRRAADPRC